MFAELAFEQRPARHLQVAEALRRLLETPVGQQRAQQRLARVEHRLVLGPFLRNFERWCDGAGLELQQRGRHQDELTRDIEVGILPRTHGVDELVDDQ